MEQKLNSIVHSDEVNTSSPFYYLSTNRLLLMGLSIIYVVWFHSGVSIDFLPIASLNKAFKLLKTFGYGGVDIFLLISGMGIYESLEKNNISKYIKNRFMRIAPVWWTYLLLCVILGRFVFNIFFSKLQILGFATFTGYWLNMQNQGNWYAYAIVFFYLISPILHSLFKNSKNKTLTCICLVAISIIISFSFFRNEKLIVFSRFSIYIIGMYVSSSLKNFKIKRSYWIYMLLAFSIGVVVLLLCYKYIPAHLWLYGLWWYPFILIAPSASLLIAKGADLCKKAINPLLVLLSVLGKSSFEILLISDYFFANFYKLNIKIFNTRITSLTVVVMSFIMGTLFHYAITSVIKLFKKRKNIKK